MWKRQVTTGAIISYWGSVGSEGYLSCPGNNNSNASDGSISMSDVRVSLQLDFPPDLQCYLYFLVIFFFFCVCHPFTLSYSICGAAPVCSNLCQRVQQHSGNIRVRTVWGQSHWLLPCSLLCFFFSDGEQMKRNLFCVRSVFWEENKQQTEGDIIRVDAAGNYRSSEALMVHCFVFGPACLATVAPLLRNDIIINIITINCWIKEKAKHWYNYCDDGRIETFTDDVCV